MDGRTQLRSIEDECGLDGDYPLVIPNTKGDSMVFDLSKLNGKQLLFFRARARHVGYGGARGGGKSWAMRMVFVGLACRYSGLKLLLLRRDIAY